MDELLTVTIYNIGLAYIVRVLSYFSIICKFLTSLVIQFWNDYKIRPCIVITINEVESKLSINK